MVECKNCGKNTKYPMGEHKNLCGDCYDWAEGAFHKKYMQKKFEHEQDKKEDELIKGMNELNNNM